MKTATTTTFLAVLAAAVLLIAATCPAAIPDKVNYQVMLTDDLDNPLADQSVELVFRIYDDADAGTQLWTETHNTTTNSIGVVSVTLGETNSLSTVGFTVPLWLEVQVDGETLDPRRELVTSPYAFMAGDAEELGGQAAVDYALDADLSDPGTINAPGNPVDWTKLKNVPADFADGADDVGGSGDGHSLDAADGSPANVVYVDGDGIVSVQNVSNPELRIEATGGGDVGLSFIRPSATYGDYRFLNDSGKMYLQYDVDDGATWELTHYFTENGALGLGRVASGGYMLDAEGGGRLAGDLDLGENGTADGSLDVYRNGSASAIFSVFDDVDRGATVRGRDASGNKTYFLRPDADTQGGGELVVMRNSSEAWGFHVAGNDADTQATTVTIDGPDREIRFETKSEGDACVQFPPDAISASEMLDEVGAGSAGLPDFTVPPAFDTFFPILSQTIDAPATGYALVIGTCRFRLQHDPVNFTGADVTMGVSTSSTSIPTDQYVSFILPKEIGGPASKWTVPITAHGVFPVSEGANTFYLVADMHSDFVDDTWYSDAQLSVIYIPTPYGDVYTHEYPSPSKTTESGEIEEIEPARTPLTPADIEAESSASIAANQARIDRELAEMRAEMERLRRELKEAQR